MMHGFGRTDMDFLAVELDDYSARAFRIAPVTSVPDVLNGAPGIAPIGNEEPAPGDDDEGRGHHDGIPQADHDGQGRQRVDGRSRHSSGLPDDKGWGQKAAAAENGYNPH